MAHNGNGRQARNGNGRRNGNGQHHSAHQAPAPVWFTARKRRRQRPPPSKLPLFVLSAFLLLFTFSGTTVFATLIAFQGGVSAYNDIERALPPLTELANHETYKTAQIFDRQGMLLWEFNHPEGGKRTVVPISDISQNLIDATLAAEDANFYANPGVDVRALARAVVQNVSGGEVVSGASTITQQLVKNVLIPEDERFEQSWMRKVKEALLAVQVNEQFSKSQILEMYLNEILYGNLAFGAEAAAQTYFGKHARDLTLGEASLLAGLPQAPSAYDPYQNFDAATRRQGYVLDQMERHGFITHEQAEDARNEQLVLTRKEQQILSPHWSQYVRSIVEQKYGEKVLYQGGLKIYTTLDSDLQNRLEEVARGNQELFDKWQANNTSIVAINPRTGEILAMVGSRDFNNAEIDGQVNVAISERQPGSAIKPLVYATAFQKGWGPYTVVDDVKSCWLESVQTQVEWCPENYDLKFNGKMTIRSALGNSINIPAVRALEFAGIEAVKSQAEKEGITTWGDKFLGLSLTLGGAEMKPLELAGSYTVFANNGLWIPPVSITKIVDAYGDVLEEYRVPQGEQVMDPRIAYQINNILSDNNARLITFGPNNVLADFDRPVAAKTGTTDNYRDTWTVGYTPNLVVGVWFGNTDGTPMVKAISSLSAGKVWHDAIQTTFEHLQLPVEPFQRPEGLVDRDFCGPGISACPYKEFWLKERQNQIPVQGRPASTEPRPGPTPNGQPDGQPPAATAGPSEANGQPQPGADQPDPNAEPTKREIAPADQPPVEPAPEPAPAEPQPEPVEPQPAPAEPAPAEPAPAGPAAEPVAPVEEQPPPAEPAPAEPAPVEPAPVEPAPAG